MERFHLEALVDSLCDDMQSAGRAVTFQGAETGRLPFYGRSNALRRALSNLIDNAIKYGQQAQVTLTLTADTEEKMQSWRTSNPQNKHGVHHYRLEDFGLDREELRRDFAPYRARFRIDEE